MKIRVYSKFLSPFPRIFYFYMIEFKNMNNIFYKKLKSKSKIIKSNTIISAYKLIILKIIDLIFYALNDYKRNLK